MTFHIRRFDRQFSRREFLRIGSGFVGAGLLMPVWAAMEKHGEANAAYPEELRSIEDYTGGKVDAAKRAIEYMGLTEGMALTDIEIDTVFIGSCTNGRIEDLRAAAAILKGKKIKEGMRAMIVPGSGLVRAQAEEEGLADIFKEAGFEWRLAGCSMCLSLIHI